MNKADEQLLEAVYLGKVLDAVEALKLGANPNLRDDDVNASYYNAPILFLCIEFEVNNDFYNDEYDPTADYKEIFDMLIENKDELNLDLNLADKDGNTPLHLACLYGAFWAIKSLLDAGARGDIENNIKQAPFQTFLYYNDLEKLTGEEEEILKELQKRSGIFDDFEEVTE